MKKQDCKIPADQILKLIQNLLSFPNPKICKHAVCCNLLSILEQNKYPINEKLAGAVVQANDEEAIRLIKQLKID